MREKWIERSAKIGNIEQIDQKNNKYMYVTYAKDYDGRARMYHVWQDDRWLVCTANYHEAVEIFERDEDD